MKCAVYVRTNCNQDNQQTLEDQINHCRAFIKSHGLLLQSVYQDVGSGNSIDLPGLQQLLKDASEKKFDLVVVKTVSRFSRKLNLINDVFDTLYSSRVEVLSIDENPFLQSLS